MEKPDHLEIERIERYLNGEMMGEELLAFEKAIQENQELADNVEEIRHYPNELTAIEKDRLTQQVKSWMAEDGQVEPVVGDKPKSKTKVLSLRLRAIAAVLVLVILAAGLWLIPGSNDLTSLSAEYLAQHYQDPVVLRAATDANWESAIELYRGDQFDQMIQEMKGWIGDDAATAEQLLYFALANCYSENPNFDVALDYFKKTEQKDLTTYAEVISWNKALIFARRQELNNARVELEKIKDSREFGEDVKKMLDAIK